MANSAQGTTMTFAYDAWGRTTSKSLGAKTAEYAYRYGSKLYSVASSVPGEGSATYETGADHKLRARTEGGTTTRYRWDAGFNILNDENGAGTLERTYVHHPLNWTGVGTVLADVAGSNPAAGDYRYYFHDHLGSTRMLYAQNKALLAQYRFTPYGEAYDLRGAPLTRGFTGQLWDPALGQYYFPMRHYAPGLGRWTSREPSGIDGPNLYHYGFGSPINGYDFLGLRFLNWVLRLDAQGKWPLSRWSTWDPRNSYFPPWFNTGLATGGAFSMGFGGWFIVGGSALTLGWGLFFVGAAATAWAIYDTFWDLPGTAEQHSSPFRNRNIDVGSSGGC